jgi:hypothetical protein
VYKYGWMPAQTETSSSTNATVFDLLANIYSTTSNFNLPILLSPLSHPS